MRPDGHLHIEGLALNRGQAIFVRAPNGRTALITFGRADAGALASQVAEHLAIWEHQLDDVVALDQSAEQALGLTLERYPALQRMRATAPVRLDLGDGAKLTLRVVDGQLRVAAGSASASPMDAARAEFERASTSVPTTFAARPGSAD